MHRHMHNMLMHTHVHTCTGVCTQTHIHPCTNIGTCMCLYAYMCLHTHMHTDVRAYTCTHMRIYTRVHTCWHTMRPCTNTGIYMCLCTCMCAHIYPHTHVHMYATDAHVGTHTHIHAHTHGHTGHRLRVRGRLLTPILLGSLTDKSTWSQEHPPLHLFNTFVEKSFIHQTIHPFKVYNSMGFNLFTELGNHHHN